MAVAAAAGIVGKVVKGAGAASKKGGEGGGKKGGKGGGGPLGLVSKLINTIKGGAG